jgi:hypothetical protein
MADLSRATYIRSPDDKPLGLELKNFDKPEHGAQPQKRELELINEIMD